MMDPPHNSGIPRSDKRSISDETNNNTAYATPKHGDHAHLPQEKAISHGLTPPHEHQEWHQQVPQPSSLHYQNSYDASVPSNAGHNHPPTPPMRDGGYDALQPSLAHQLSQLGRGQMGSRQDHTNPMMQHQGSPSQGYASLNLYDPRGLLQPAPFFSTEAPHAQHLPPPARPTQPTHYPAHVLQSHWQPNAGQDATAQAQRYMVHQKRLPHGMPFYGEPSPTHGLPQFPPASPAVQQWPTSTLGRQPYVYPPVATPSRPLSNANPFVPSPGHDSRTPLDDETMKKMARFAESAALHRRASLVSQDGVTLAPATPKRGTKRKKPSQKPDQVVATPPPSLRRASGQADAPGPGPRLQPGTHEFAIHHPHFNVRSTQYGYDAADAYSAYPSAHAPTTEAPYDARLLREIAGTQMDWFSGRSPTQQTVNEMTLNTSVSFPQAALAPPQKLPSPMTGPVDWDAVALPIARDYADFKYSVYHYEVNPKLGYAYAQSWLDDLLAANLEPGKHKWHTHTSPGFIVKGSPLSVLVLHNAVNPFEWRNIPEDTTTIGVYGIEHDHIHWKTVAPSLKWILEYSAQPTVDTITLKHKHVSTEKNAKQKRWHRAYFLAATRRPLRGMLNRPEEEVEKEKDPFVISDFDYSYPYEFTADDVDSSWGAEGGWECSVDESESAWEKVKMEMEGWDWREREVVVTGCSEWE